MKVHKFVIGYVLALALFLFAQQRPETPQSGSFREVVDLTHSLSTRASRPSETSSARLQAAALREEVNSIQPGTASTDALATRIGAPARLARGMWTVDQIPAGRLVAPLVVLDVSSNARNNPEYEISVQDIARWEQANGQIPLGAVVIARTGWGTRWSSPRRYRNVDSAGVMHFPGYSEDAARFLAEGRNTLGLGIDTPSVDRGSAKGLAVDRYTSARGLYVLTNVANLDRMPANSAVAMVAPTKVEGGSAAPVRILALVR